jgi:hypothetical protein
MEILTVLELPAGFHVMNVNSDDGFRLTFGHPDEYATFPVVSGEFNGGRGSGTGVNDGTMCYVNIQQAGLYPVRLLWYEGGGGSDIEWSSRSPLDLQTCQIGTTAILINDDLQTGYIPAYQYPVDSAGAPYVKSFAPGRASLATGQTPARAGTDATLSVVLGGLVDQVADGTISVMLNGNAVTPTITTAGGEKRIEVTPADAGLTEWPTGEHDVALSFGGRTISWTVAVTSAWKTPVFFIEAEDFDTGGGQSRPEASQMPYMGGAYGGLAATHDTDYHRLDNGSSNIYRLGLGARQVPIELNNDRDRGLGEVFVNYSLGWIADDQSEPMWYNYTRNLPTGQFNVYAGLSNGSGDPDRLKGSLQQVSGGSTTELGVFQGDGTAGWNNNAFVPLTDTPGGRMLALDLGGQTTLRFTAIDGNWDYMVLVPAAEEPDGFTGSTLNTDGTVTLDWTGGGTLQKAAAVNGPYADVPGAVSGQPITPAGPEEYYRVMY